MHPLEPQHRLGEWLHHRDSTWDSPARRAGDQALGGNAQHAIGLSRPSTGRSSGHGRGGWLTRDDRCHRRSRGLNRCRRRALVGADELARDARLSLPRGVVVAQRPRSCSVCGRSEAGVGPAENRSMLLAESCARPARQQTVFHRVATRTPTGKSTMRAAPFNECAARMHSSSWSDAVPSRSNARRPEVNTSAARRPPFEQIEHRELASLATHPRLRATCGRALLVEQPPNDRAQPTALECLAVALATVAGTSSFARVEA